MPILIKLAWRNIWRAPRRTLITIGAITIGVVAIVFFFGLMDGMNSQTLENSIRGQTGHIKVYAKGYYKEPSVSKMVKRPEEILKALAAEPHVLYALPRVNGPGLISTEEKSTGVMILGLDLEKEEAISDYKRYVKAGRYYIQSGELLVGKDLAKRLKAGIGSSVSLIVQGADGSIGAENYRIGGILQVGEFSMDSTLVVMPVSDAKALMGMGKGVSEITLFLDSSENTDAVMASLGKRLNMKEIELISWKEILTVLLSMRELVEIFKYIPLIILIVVTSLGILNTILMSVTERTREMGIMTALGTRPSLIVFLILLETSIMSLIGALSGASGGLALLYVFGKKGIDLSHWAEGLRTIPFHPTTIYPIMEGSSFYVAIVVVTISAVISAVYPAVKAARLRPVEAIRFV